MSRSTLTSITGTVPLLTLILVAVSLALYWQSVHHGFISIDDGSLVVQNELVQRPLDIPTVRRIFTSYDPELYVPLTLMSYRTDFWLGGLDPAVFHVRNVLLHSIAVLLVFWLLLQLHAGRAAALIGALLFAVHPINAEAVLWIAARKDLLSTVWGLLSLNAFLRWTSGGDRRWYRCALLAFLFGLLSKGTILLLPVLFVLFDAREGRMWKKKFVELSPFVVLSALFAAIAVLGKLRTFGAAIPLSSYPLLSAKAVMLTLGKIVLPFSFSPLYPQMTPVTLASPEFWLPVIGVSVLTLVIILLWRQCAILRRSATFFLVGFAPSFLVFTKNGELYATSDRYAYLASVGVIWLAAVAIVRVYEVMKRHRTAAALWQFAVACVIAALFVATYAQSGVWRTDESLMRHIIATTPDHALAYNNLGVDLMQAQQYASAEKEFRTAIRLNPHFILPRMNLAGLLMKQKNPVAAEGEYRAAVAAIDRTKRIRSDDLTAYYVLAGIVEAKGDVEGALALFAEAAALGSDIAEAQYNMAVTFQKYGNIEQAVAAYRRAIALDSGLVDAHFNLAEILAGQGMLDDALSELDAVLELQPGHEQARTHRENIKRLL